MNKVPTYEDAIQWILEMGETEWLKGAKPVMTESACLVADIFGKSHEQVLADLTEGLAGSLIIF